MSTNLKNIHHHDPSQVIVGKRQRVEMFADDYLRPYYKLKRSQQLDSCHLGTTDSLPNSLIQTDECSHCQNRKMPSMRPKFLTTLTSKGYQSKFQSTSLSKTKNKDVKALCSLQNIYLPQKKFHKNCSLDSQSFGQVSSDSNQLDKSFILETQSETLSSLSGDLLDQLPTDLIEDFTGSEIQIKMKNLDEIEAKYPFRRQNVKKFNTKKKGKWSKRVEQFRNKASRTGFFTFGRSEELTTSGTNSPKMNTPKFRF